MAVKEIPNNPEAEQAVIGSMFLEKNALQKACEVLNPESFYFNNNAKIFGTIKEMAEKKVPIDLTTVTTELKNKNILNEVGGVEYLTEILDSVATAANIDQYVKSVEESALLRKLIEVSTNITTTAYNSDKSVNETIDDAERKILSVVKNRRSSEFRTIKDVLIQTQRNLEILAQSKSDVTGIATGWYDIDKLTTGLHGSQLIIIAARPAMGKTAFALNLATNVALNSGKPVALFNLEMGAEQLANRMLSSLGQVEGNKIATGKLLNDDWKRINEAISQLSEAKLYMDDTPGLTIGEIRSKCRRLASSDEGLGLVVIDYLQLITSSTNYGTNRQQEVSDISRSLKTMALELNVPVIALAQLSRAVDSRENKRPIISDLRESGSIEQDADIVAFLYRDDYYNKEKVTDSNTSISEFIVAKHRNGPTKTIELLFKRDTSTFLSYQSSDMNGE
ncbi:MAG: replicative DNA helicase [Firmicutes bacterium]|nr:replicative DNA helicase [Bacillota bacterium]